MTHGGQVSAFIKFKIVFVAIATFAATSGLTMSFLSIGLGFQYGINSNEF